MLSERNHTVGCILGLPHTRSEIMSFHVSNNTSELPRRSVVLAFRPSFKYDQRYIPMVFSIHPVYVPSLRNLISYTLERRRSTNGVPIYKLPNLRKKAGNGKRCVKIGAPTPTTPPPIRTTLIPLMWHNYVKPYRKDHLVGYFFITRTTPRSFLRYRFKFGRYRLCVIAQRPHLPQPPDIALWSGVTYYYCCTHVYSEKLVNLG